MKNSERKNMTSAAIITLTGCLIQLVPVLDSHPIGSSVLVILTLCWAMKERASPRLSIDLALKSELAKGK
jgi:hypothetical protein